MGGEGGADVDQATNKFAAWLQLLMEALKRDKEMLHTVHTMAGGAAEHAMVVVHIHQPASETKPLRVARDGKLYTEAEFHRFYGLHYGTKMWMEAASASSPNFRKTMLEDMVRQISDDSRKGGAMLIGDANCNQQHW